MYQPASSIRSGIIPVLILALTALGSFSGNLRAQDPADGDAVYGDTGPKENILPDRAVSATTSTRDSVGPIDPPMLVPPPKPAVEPTPFGVALDPDLKPMPTPAGVREVGPAPKAIPTPVPNVEPTPVGVALVPPRPMPTPVGISKDPEPAPKAAPTPVGIDKDPVTKGKPPVINGDPITPDKAIAPAAATTTSARPAPAAMRKASPAAGSTTRVVAPRK